MKNDLMMRVTKCVDVEVGTRDIGVAIADATDGMQASFFVGLLEAVQLWGADVKAIWPIQCRGIAELLTDDQCHRLAPLLETLAEHLEAIPRERLAKAIAKSAADNLAEGLRAAIGEQPSSNP